MENGRCAQALIRWRTKGANGRLPHLHFTHLVLSFDLAGIFPLLRKCCDGAIYMRSLVSGSLDTWNETRGDSCAQRQS